MSMRRWIWWRWLCETFGLAGSRRNRSSRTLQHRPILLERLEPREVPATITVTTLSDAASHTGTSLRDAIASASAGDTIQFASSLSGAIDLNPADGGQGTLTINKNLTIQETYGQTIAIEGGMAASTSNVQDLIIGTGDVVTLTDLTIRYGYIRGSGGGIVNDGQLTLLNSTVSGNSATNGGGIYNAANSSLTLNGSTLSGNNAGNYGGGIYNNSTGSVGIYGSTLSGNTAGYSGGGMSNSGTATISGSTLSGNLAYQEGGGIRNDSTLTITGSTISGNSAGFNGGGIYGNLNDNVTISGCTLTANSARYSGGGILSYGSLALSASTLSGNSAGIAGGAIYNYIGVAYITGSTLDSNTAPRGGGVTNSGTASIQSSTLSDNSATTNGGGIQNRGTLTVTDSTLFGNTATNAGGGVSSSAGNLSLLSSTLADNLAATGGGINTTGTTILSSSLVANNTGADPDIAGSISASSDHNLIRDGTGMNGISNGSNGNQIGTSTDPINPLLSAPGNWGGPTQTLAPLPGSPAIGGGGNTIQTTDQRGFVRAIAGRLDIGAVETGGYTITVVSGNNQTAAISTSFAQPLVVQITANNGVDPVIGGQITFLAPGSGASAGLSSSPAVINASSQASAAATANGIAGAYVVTTTDAGATSSAAFDLTNTEASPAPTPSPTSTPSPTPGWIASLLLWAEHQFAILADNFISTAENESPDPQRVNWLMHILQDVWLLENTALCQGLTALQSAQHVNPADAAIWAQWAQTLAIYQA